MAYERNGKRTFRMVLDTETGQCSIDVAVRGESASAVAAVGQEAHRWLDEGIGMAFAGVWEDHGTDHEEGGECDCWVSKHPAETTFSIRNGAHNPTCPVFRPSMDPVDAYHDAGLRMREETGIPTHI